MLLNGAILGTHSKPLLPSNMPRHVDMSLLLQLLALKEHGTLSEASRHVHLTQPTLSRSMRRLEEIFGVRLFDHGKNRITLTPSGELAAKLARGLLDAERSMVERVRAFDRSARTIAVGSVAPGPLFELDPLIRTLYPEVALRTQVAKDADSLLASLSEDACNLAVLPAPPRGQAFFAKRCIREELYLSVPEGDPLFTSPSVSFEEADGRTFLMVSEVGLWGGIVRRRMPRARFLLQESPETLDILVKSSALPSFATSISARFLHFDDGRRHVPVRDPEAGIDFYLVCLEPDRERFKALFDALPLQGPGRTRGASPAF